MSRSNQNYCISYTHDSSVRFQAKAICCLKDLYLKLNSRPIRNKLHRPMFAGCSSSQAALLSAQGCFSPNPRIHIFCNHSLAFQLYEPLAPGLLVKGSAIHHRQNPWPRHTPQYTQKATIQCYKLNAASAFTPADTLMDVHSAAPPAMELLREILLFSAHAFSHKSPWISKSESATWMKFKRNVLQSRSLCAHGRRYGSVAWNGGGSRMMMEAICTMRQVPVWVEAILQNWGTFPATKDCSFCSCWRRDLRRQILYGIYVDRARNRL